MDLVEEREQQLGRVEGSISTGEEEEGCLEFKGEHEIENSFLMGEQMATEHSLWLIFELGGREDHILFRSSSRRL